MTLKVIGAGIGRTGTYSLKTALNEMGLGPSHAMEEVLHHIPVQLPLWQAALNGSANWAAVYNGYASAVDWPTASFFRELNVAYPDTKFILTVRSPESWVESFSETIYTLLARRDLADPHMHDWLDWATALIAKTGFPTGLDKRSLARAFNAHNEAVKATIPTKNLLVYEVRQGWEPLSKFLGLPVPATEFPNTNSREDFWGHVGRPATLPS